MVKLLVTVAVPLLAPLSGIGNDCFRLRWWLSLLQQIPLTTDTIQVALTRNANHKVVKMISSMPCFAYSLSCIFFYFVLSSLLFCFVYINKNTLMQTVQQTTYILLMLFLFYFFFLNYFTEIKKRNNLTL